MSERIDTIELDGYQFAVVLERDDLGAPWEEDDGHGIVSEWTTRPKAPGERVLCEDRSSRRYYDVAATMKLALKDGWGPRESREGETKGQQAARAVEDDYQRMRGWCQDEWWWVGVIVTLLDADGGETKETASLWGIESDAGKYLDEVARELAEEIVGRLDGATVLTIPLRVQEVKP